MMSFIPRQQHCWSKRLVSCIITLTLTTSLIVPPGSAQAQVIGTIPDVYLPTAGDRINSTEGYTPPIIQAFKIFPDDPLRFDFIIDTGDAELDQIDFEEESKKLIKYFLASLTVPSDELWVNLSPYEDDRIIPEKFGVTEMGRDLLAQDYILKQLTASLLYPEDEIGEEFWQRIYDRAYELYGTTEVPINTFNKVWIVPDLAVVHSSGDVAAVIETHLKVMLEGDYYAIKENLNNKDLATDTLEDADVEQISEVSSEIIREIVLPEIEREVNEGKNFAPLRQIYNSMILATWFKQNLKEHFLGKVYAEKNKIGGIDVQDKDVKEKIYQQYLDALNEGVYDYFKNDYDPNTQSVIPRCSMFARRRSTRI